MSEGEGTLLYAFTRPLGLALATPPAGLYTHACCGLSLRRVPGEPRLPALSALLDLARRRARSCSRVRSALAARSLPQGPAAEARGKWPDRLPALRPPSPSFRWGESAQRHRGACAATAALGRLANVYYEVLNQEFQRR
jgi:hypothetical protein